MQVYSNKTIVILGGEHLAMIKEMKSLFPVKFEVKDMERLSLYLYQNHEYSSWVLPSLSMPLNLNLLFKLGMKDFKLTTTPLEGI